MKRKTDACFIHSSAPDRPRESRSSVARHRNIVNYLGLVAELPFLKIHHRFRAMLTAFGAKKGQDGGTVAHSGPHQGEDVRMAMPQPKHTVGWIVEKLCDTGTTVSGAGDPMPAGEPSEFSKSIGAMLNRGRRKAVAKLHEKDIPTFGLEDGRIIEIKPPRK